MALNIVCLHGFTQNSEIFKKKLSNLIKSNKNINLYYLNGSVVLPSDPNTNSRAYWTYSEENPSEANWMDHYKTDTILYHLDDSLESFINLGKEIGNIDGIIGFSQGGCFADYICKMHAIDKIPFDIKFVVFIAAESFNRPGNEFYNVNPVIQSLHIYGMMDTIIPSVMSEALSQSYANKEIFVHKGAHVIPSNSAAKTALKNLFKIS
jgi:predicted esterase